MLGNLYLIQLQALVVGGFTGVSSLILGSIFHSRKNSLQESLLMITSAMSTASISSFIMSSFMCAVIITSRKFRINPDNIATPLAASVGDLTTLTVLALLSEFYFQHCLNTVFLPIILIAFLLLIPVSYSFISRHSIAKNLVRDGWLPILISVAFSSLAGLFLERYIMKYYELAILLPVFNGFVQKKLKYPF